MNRAAVAAGAGAVAAVALASGIYVGTQTDSAPASFEVRKLAETPTTITLGWDKQPDADGYRFYVNDAVVSRTFDPAKVSVKFTKASSYRVEVQEVSFGGSGVYPPPPDPPPTTTTEPPPLNVANLWVDADGGACVDLATPGQYNDAAACSPQQAIATCDAGDLVYVKGGATLAGFSIPGAATDAAASNNRLSACVLEPAPGTGPVKVNGDINLGSPGNAAGPGWLTFRNWQLGDPASYLNESEISVWDADNVWLDRVDAASFDSFSSTNTKITFGDWGPCSSSATRKCVPRLASTVDAVVTGNRFHHQICGTPTATQTRAQSCGLYHSDGMAHFGGTGTLIARNTFDHNDITHIRFQNCCGNVPMANITVESNFFGVRCESPSSVCGTLTVGGFDVDSPIPGFRALFNTMIGGVSVQTTMGTNDSPALWRGNAFVQAGPCWGNTTYSANVVVPWNENWGATPCGSSDKALPAGPFEMTAAERVSYVTNKFGLVSQDDPHLKAGSPLIDWVQGAFCVGTDIDGQPRTAPCDAGSDER